MYQQPLSQRQWVCGVVILLSICCVWVSPGQAQQAAADTARVVTILQADSSVGYVRNGSRVRSLRGNVRLRQDSTYLGAQRVLQYVAQDSIIFTGDVQIVDQGDTLTADRVRYNRRTKVGQAEGHVFLADGEVTLQAPSGVYYVDEKRARFTKGVRMRDSVSTLVSKTGEYWLNDKRAVFQQSVTLKQEQTTLKSDSLVHFRENALSRAFGNVVINHVERDSATTDTLRQLLLFGEQAMHDEQQNINRLTGDPLLMQLRYDSTQTDTLLLRAEKIEARQQPSRRRLTGRGKVRFWQNRFSATADSVAYQESLVQGPPADTSGGMEMQLFGQPVVWMDETQVSGDTLRAVGEGEQIDSLWVYSQAFVASPDTLSKRIHQLSGKKLRASMANNQLKYLHVGPNAKAVRFLASDNQPNGAVEVSADYIEGWFVAETLERIRATGGIEGTYYDLSNLPEELQLEGFQWLPEQRPTKKMLLGANDRSLAKQRVWTRYTHQ